MTRLAISAVFGLLLIAVGAVSFELGKKVGGPKDIRICDRSGKWSMGYKDKSGKWTDYPLSCETLEWLKFHAHDLNPAWTFTR